MQTWPFHPLENAAPTSNTWLFIRFLFGSSSTTPCTNDSSTFGMHPVRDHLNGWWSAPWSERAGPRNCLHLPRLWTLFPKHCGFAIWCTVHDLNPRVVVTTALRFARFIWFMYLDTEFFFSQFRWPIARFTNRNKLINPFSKRKNSTRPGPPKAC